MNFWRGVLIFVLLASILVVAYLSYYVFINFYSTPEEFDVSYIHENFNNESALQFFPNMRFKSNEISYFISEDCPQDKRERMLQAFSYLENETILRFHESLLSQISVTCNPALETGGLFIAGEGGPTKIIISPRFNVIEEGEIVLLSSSCGFNVELHELFHVLGFNHSGSPDDIMYNVSSCPQTVSKNLLAEISRVYSFPSMPDLYFENVSSLKKGNYLSLNFTVKNQGITSSENFTVTAKIGSQQETFDFEGVTPGAGRIFSVSNIRVPLSSDEIIIQIQDSEDLDYENNIATLTLS